MHFAEEGILVRIDNNNSAANKYRLFHTRSRTGILLGHSPGSISHDGKYVFFHSNFDISSSGLPAYMNAYLGECSNEVECVRSFIRKTAKWPWLVGGRQALALESLAKSKSRYDCVLPNLL